MNKVIAGLLGAVGLAIAASSSVAVAAPMLTDGAQVQNVQYAPGYRPGYRPGYNRYRPHYYHRGNAFGRFHGRPHFARGYRR